MARQATAPRADHGSMTELRKLVFGDEEKRVAAALPRAVAMRARSDRHLAIALEPLLADTLHDTATRHPERLAEALQPVIGQAVRKAVAAALATIIERVNQALEHTFSVRSLRWRLEAMRTGRPFAEIVLLHSLVFRVEQVFLVHKRSGLLLAHAAADPGETRDPDQIAAMLNVIEKFVHDAFREGATLTRFEVGDLQGRIEIGSEATLTAVVRGMPPEDLSRVLREALDRIQLEFRDPLIDFRGNTAPFAAADAILADCLVERRVERKSSKVFSIVGAVVALGLVFLIGRGVIHARERNRSLRAYESALQEQPGVVVMSATRDGDHFIFSGLRDPLSPEPAAILSSRGLDPARATVRLEPFYSLDPRLVAPRVRAALSPPSSVSVAVEGGVLRVTGTAPREWLVRARAVAGILPGVHTVDASHAREREAIDEVRAAQKRIEAASFGFEVRRTDVGSSDNVRLDAVARDATLLLRNAAAAGVTAKLVVEAFADAKGSSAENHRLSLARAESMVAALVARGVPLTSLLPHGGGEKEDLDPSLARRAVVRVVLDGAP